MFAQVLLSLLLFTNVSRSYKILVVSPKIGYSHMNFMGKIADTLVDAGHEVVTLQPVIFPHVSNGTLKSRIIHVNVDKTLTDDIAAEDDQNQEKMWTSSATNPLAVLGFTSMFKRIITAMISGTLDDNSLLKRLQEEKFDVGITELFDFYGIAVFEAIELKNIIGTHSSTIMEGTSYAVGAPVIPSFMPASQGVTDDSTNFVNRAVNMLFTTTSWYFQSFAAKVAESVMIEKLGSSVTPIWDVVSNMPFILTNTEPLLEFAKPSIYKVVDIGGIGVHRPKPLDEKWDRILNLRRHTVLLSFGSVVRCKFMPLEIKKAIVEMIRSFHDVTFIWKYEELEDASFAAGIENLFLSKWTPQNDLLADDRLTLFITHGGAGSLLESATRGKPMIVVPLFADQSRNAKLIVKFGLGIMLNKEDLWNSKKMYKAIDGVLSDQRYQKAAHRMRNILARQTFTKEQKLLETVEMAAEFGEMPELRVAGRNLGIIAYYNLDLWFMVFVVILLISYFLLLVTQLLLNKFIRKADSTVKLKTK